MPTLDEIKRNVLKGAESYNNAVDFSKRVVRIELFGSYACGNASEDSDIDLLVEFATPHVGLFSLATILDAMEKATGMSVDIVQAPLPPGSLLEIERSVRLYDAA